MAVDLVVNDISRLCNNFGDEHCQTVDYSLCGRVSFLGCVMNHDLMGDLVLLQLQLWDENPLTSCATSDLNTRPMRYSEIFQPSCA